MAPAAVITPAPATHATLRRLFLALFLRGRSARGLDPSASPASIGAKLWRILAVYTFVGLSALAFIRQPIFFLSAALHALTFVMLGMFVAASAGELLFNKEEADILLHRPVTPRALLWAKVRVLVEVSLWLAGALNVVAFIVGTVGQGGAWFPIVHAVSIAMEALFCTGCVVLAYQLCLRWFGRAVLDHVMTGAQVVVAIALTAGSQIVPRMIGRLEGRIDADAIQHLWWLGLLPPAWFAAFDAAFTGGGTRATWGLAAIGVAATAAVLGLAFGKLAGAYGRGLQTLGEGVQRPAAARTSRRWLEWLVDRPPLRWWLRDAVARAAFLLTARYLVRDRDVMLRVYPGLAPMLVMPFVFMIGPNLGRGLGLALTGGFLAMLPLMGVALMRYSQQWQAADIFRAAPLPGPAPLCHGVRRAVLLVLTAPLLAFFGALAWLLNPDWSTMVVFLPGLVLLPVYALVPCLDGAAVPLSQPGEEAKAAGRGARMFGITLVAMALGGLGLWARSGGWIGRLLLVEASIVVLICALLRRRVDAAAWPALE